jgi:hypothetical protein
VGGVRGAKSPPRSALTSAWIITPVSATSSRPVSLEDDQRAVAVGRQGDAAWATSSAMCSTVRVSAREEPVERADPADPLERPAELGLEDGDQANRPTTARVWRIWVRSRRSKAGRRIDREQDADADHGLTARVPRMRLKSQ